MGNTLLLTGGAGFIGHHVFEHVMKKTDWKVVLLDGLSYAGNLNRLAHIEMFEKWKKERRFEFIYHDIRSPFNESVLAKIGRQVNFVLHLAAETFVDRSIAYPREFVTTNVEGTVNVLELTEKMPNLERFIYISTDEVFGPAEDSQYFQENDPYSPSNPYSASKAAAECFVKSWHKSRGLPALIVRTMNNFGERQHPEKFIGSLLRSMIKGEECIVHGTPATVGSRHWLHARNFADALLFLLGHGEVGQAYHVIGQEMNNLVLARLVAEYAGLEFRPKFVDFHLSRPGHDRRYAMADNNLKALGWRAPMSLEDSLKSTVQWTLGHPEWLEMDIFISTERRPSDGKKTI
jgi:dTDP-glucose 4,6-dehydratase